MRGGEVFRYEVEHRLRSGSTWVYAAFLLALAFLVVHIGEGETVRVNAPERVAWMSAMFCGLFGMLVTAALFADAALRDAEAGMDPFLATTRLTPREFLGGRFLAAFTVNAIVLLATPIGIAIATQMPYLDREDFAPLRLASFVQPYVLFQLPNVLLVGAILFAIAALTRQAILAYLGAVAVLVGYITAANYWSYIQNPTASLLADPLGLNALTELTRTWTPAEKNARLIGFPAALLLNRLLWIAVAWGVLALLHRVFRFSHADGTGRSGRRARVTSETRTAREAPVAVPRIAGVFDIATRVRQVLAVARRALADIVSGRAFIVTIIGCAGVVLLMGWNVGSTVFDTSTWPATFLVAGEVVSSRILPIVWIVVALHAGELVWKEREVGTNEIGDAMPLPEGVFFLGRVIALIVLIAAFHLAFMVGGVTLQALQGYRDFELGLYARILFGLDLVDFALLGTMAMAVHVIVNQKYVGHIVSMIAFAFTKLAPAFGVRHHMLAFGTAPKWTYSDMNGFGPFIAPWGWFKLYWGGWALLLAVVAALLWVRGPQLGLGNRLHVARRRLGGGIARALALAVALILTTGGFVFYNTNVLHDYYPADARGTPQAQYERRYKRFERTLQPTITAADLHVEIHPRLPGLDLRGTYRLTNRHASAIDSVHVYLDPSIGGRRVEFDRPAKVVLDDEEIGYRIYALERPLPPDDSLRLRFDLEYRPRGFSNDGAQTDVVENGTSFDRRFLPFVGYQPMLELADAAARERLGLPRRPVVPPSDDSTARMFRHQWRDADLVDLAMVVGTDADQTVVTPGVLRRTWESNGRRYFQFASERPLPFGATVYSGRYAVAEDRWNDVTLRVYHHPSHRHVLEPTMRGMKASLEYFSKAFGPYPDTELRVVEYPRYGGFGIAHPHTVAFSEDYFFSRVKDGEIDQPFYGTAHEVAHQWWGGQGRGAAVRGAAFISEALANYSAMMLMEKTFGPDVARRVYGFQMDRYLTARAERSREAATLDVEDQSYLAYRKGALALYTMRERLGEATMNGALRRFIEKYRDAGPPYPTSRDLYAEVRAVTPESLRPLLHDLFEDVVLWDVRTRRAVVERTGDGRFEVTIDVSARKVRADSVGREVEVPMDDDVEIGIFAAPSGEKAGERLYLQRHRIRSGQQTLRITVSRAPARAGIDPDRMLMDRDRDDNVVDVRPKD